MGLFRRAGRTVERLKQSVESAADEEATYGCVECDEQFYVARSTCDTCGGSVEPLE
jgi:hypothetical protein